MPTLRSCARRRSTRPWTAALITMLVAVAACTGGADEEAGGEAHDDDHGHDHGEDAFPVHIEHAFGETDVDQEPARIVAWDSGSADAAIAVGAVPVAVPRHSGGGGDGLAPWTTAALDARGADPPEVLPATAAPPFDAIDVARPDLVLAADPALTQDAYDRLAASAPTVGPPEESDGRDPTAWRRMIESVGTAVGRADEAQDVLRILDGDIAERAARHPDLVGTTVAVVEVGDDAAVVVLPPGDPRVVLARDLGLEPGGLTSDLLVAYADSPAASETFLTSEPGRALEQVRTGAVAVIDDPDMVAALSRPTALSLSWALDGHVATLSQAASRAATSS
jgi:iron complex transport system substrate-binding protein